MSDLKYMTLNTIWGEAELIISYFYFILPILFNDFLTHVMVTILLF